MCLREIRNTRNVMDLKTAYCLCLSRLLVLRGLCVDSPALLASMKPANKPFEATARTNRKGTDEQDTARNQTKQRYISSECYSICGRETLQDLPH